MSPSPAAVELSFHGGILLATVRASAIDSGNADRLCRDIESGIASAGRRFRGLLMDMGAVGFMNSRGLAVCIDLARAASEAGGRAAVIGLSEDLARMFSLMKVDRLLVPCGDERSARAYLASGDAGPAATDASGD
jgi:anti-anti-sigma factor